MAYKKPQIVAKSAAKQAFVAACPTKSATAYVDPCGHFNVHCQIASTK